MKRFRLIPIFIFCAFVLNTSYVQAQWVCSVSDSIKITQLLNLYQDSTLTLGDRVVSLGKEFLGIPYIANTLEVSEGEEATIVDLSGLDCTTFVEQIVAIAMVSDQKGDFKDVLSSIETLRYRKGIREGYASRLHYFSEWIFDNEDKALVKNLGREMGRNYPKPINFMKNHRSAYPALSSTDNYRAVVEAERMWSKKTNERFFFPIDDLTNAIEHIQSGDIIALTTTMNGLDVSHTGFAVRKGSDVFFLHASSLDKKVVLTKESLITYVSKNKRTNGIMVARPLSPQ